MEIEDNFPLTYKELISIFIIGFIFLIASINYRMGYEYLIIITIMGGLFYLLKIKK